MAKATLVSGSSISAASLPKTILQKELPITITTENEPEICKSNIQEVKIDAPTILSDLTSSRAATWPESGELITFKEIEQELYRVVLLNPPGYYRPTGLPTNHFFYDYVYLSSRNSSGCRLMGIFNRAEQAHPTINQDQCCLGLLEWLWGLYIPSQIITVSDLGDFCQFLQLMNSFLIIWTEEAEQQPEAKMTLGFKSKTKLDSRCKDVVSSNYKALITGDIQRDIVYLTTLGLL